MAQLQRLSGIDRIAIIGGGPAGVAACKYLLRENKFSHIDIFEQRSIAGGVWNYTPENDPEASFSIPQTSPFAPFEQPIWRKVQTSSGDTIKIATFLSPLYERLEANLPKDMMRHKDLAFPDSSQLFPPHAEIAEYLEQYADEVRQYVRFETQVTDLRPLEINGKRSWSITTQNLASGSCQSGNYDAVVVSNGHYTVPYVPDIKGIREWNEQYPGSIEHAKFYRNPEGYADRNVLVVGQGYSGLDIAAQVSQFSHPPLLISTRSQDPASDPNHPGTAHVAEISCFLPERRAVRLTDGTLLPAIDTVLFCTGYLYSYPFVPDPAGTSVLPAPILPPTGARTLNAYRHIFYAADPTLAFLGLPQKVVPFPVSEAQAAVVARVWAGRLGLPSREEMGRWEEETAEAQGEGAKFHYMSPPKDGDYLNELAEWCKSAEGEGRVGKVPPMWGEKDRWVRERILGMKRKFAALGEERRKVKTLEQLGYSFDEWKREQEGYEVKI